MDQWSEKALAINARLERTGLYGGAKKQVPAGQNSTFRLSPEPFWISQELYGELLDLGPVLRDFYLACNQLYHKAWRHPEWDWVREYLEMGKSESVIDFGRMKRFRGDLPLVIRPDVLWTKEGFIASELDSVPGGMGLLAALTQVYAQEGFSLVGGEWGVVDGLRDALRASDPGQTNPLWGMVVSDESADYRPEMEWLVQALNQRGLSARHLEPREVGFTEDGLWAGDARLTGVYRFFELFDLKNIPKADLFLYATRKEMVRMTPPLKAYLEEKLLFALFHHPGLMEFWKSALGGYERLQELFPPTWVLDSRPLPPHAVIGGLEMDGRPVRSFLELSDASKRQRRYVVKPSGYSALAWGSRGVSIGHDLPSTEWAQSLQHGLDQFGQTPYILQSFRKAQRHTVRYYDFEDHTIKRMSGRARLCPYYFIVGEDVRLGGILATVCPANKKVIHGMVDAVMAPVAVRPSSEE